MQSKRTESLLVPANAMPVPKLKNHTLLMAHTLLLPLNAIPIPVDGLDAPPWKVMVENCVPVVQEMRVFAGVLGIITVVLEDAPTTETPPAVMLRAPALLFSTYIPESTSIHAGVVTVDMALATVIALARLAYG